MPNDLFLSRPGVLLVDDIPANRAALRTVLEELPVDVIEAHGGEEALCLLKERDLAVVLLNLDVPGHDGLDTARQLRSREKGRLTPILFLTALTDRFPVEQAYALGAVDHLAGPVVPVVLRARVARFVELFEKAPRLPDSQEWLARLEESELRFRQLAENIREVFWMSDPYKAEVLYISPAYEEVWGRSCQSLYEQPRSFLDAIHPDDRERVVRTSLAQQSRGEGTDVEYRVVRPDGTVRWVRDRSFPVKDGSGQVYRMAGIAEDVTAWKQVETELKQADRRKDEFLAMLGHELRNPLAPIRNAVGVMRLLGPAADPTVGQCVDLIERQVQHLTRLVDDLLDVSRITRGKITLHKETVDLATVVTRAVQTSRPLIERNRHQLTLSLPAEPVRVLADPTRLEQVFSNLLTNAAKYTERGGLIGVTIARTGRGSEPAEVVVRIRDTGFGIAADLLPHVFDLFTQADDTRDRSQGGLGIGLTLVKSLVQLHGGRVTAHSDGPGKGSEFVVYLPIVVEPKESGARGQDSGVSSGMTPDSCLRAPSLRVLVVEDNKDVADSLALLFRLWGHEVRTCADGPSGLKAACSYRPEVVFLDIGLPGLDGYEVARQLRQEFGQEMRLVALSGFGQQEDRLRAEASGFDAHLTKPAEPATLKTLLAPGWRAQRDG
jgi:PAS domain S-box-containing protein